ncbi:MAG: hypothetical protein K2X91_07915, partial [Thermoleophilia bacterium]|nr:hypothetical protein [Thermoleophilia bacterium]
MALVAWLALYTGHQPSQLGAVDPEVLLDRALGAWLRPDQRGPAIAALKRLAAWIADDTRIFTRPRSSTTRWP